MDGIRRRLAGPISAGAGAGRLPSKSPAIPLDPTGFTADPLLMNIPTAARLVSTWQDERLTGVALAEREDSSGWNLVLERASTFTEKESRDGQDTYCITTEAGESVYGGVISWAVESNKLLLTLDERVSESLEIKSRLAIEVPAKDAAELKAKLAVILA